ncbi:MAG: DUF411 domain-containing protein [Luteitalea sp.]|nr:DUF411 domain-containing protein [Luteitalea sp.]
MKVRIGIVAIGLCAAALIGRAQAPASRPVVTVYKSPTCGCCSKWVDHMKDSGFDVKALDVDDIDLVKKTYGVPPALGSCHTALVGGYVIEGHVPAEAVARLVRERPALTGIAVPGMPVGSPGMEMGGRRDPYSVMSFDKTGKLSVYERR